jgi:predicted dehydrogenase
MSAGAHKSVVFDYLSPGEGVSSKVIWEGEESWDAVHLGPLADFAHAIRSGHPPRTTLEQALVVQKITDAIYRSAATGKAVAIH